MSTRTDRRSTSRDRKILRRLVKTPAGERLALVPEAEYRALLEAAEDAADYAAHAQFHRKLAAGEEELIPSAIVDRILDGENRIRVWREHRGLTIAALAEASGVSAPLISQIESGKKDGSIGSLKKMAKALAVTLDDLAA